MLDGGDRQVILWRRRCPTTGHHLVQGGRDGRTPHCIHTSTDVVVMLCGARFDGSRTRRIGNSLKSVGGHEYVVVVPVRGIKVNNFTAAGDPRIVMGWKRGFPQIIIATIGVVLESSYGPCQGGDGRMIPLSTSTLS